MSSIKTRKSEDFSRWYHEVIATSKLVDISPLQGCIVYSPYCLAIWEQIKKFIGEKLKKIGFKEYYFPTLIPLISFKKQKEHYDDFFREVLVVGKVGGNKLEGEFIIRPTSEAIMYESFAKWVKEEKDLPLLVNQYCSVVRWESLKPNMPLIRGNEFLWQESHSVHAAEQETDRFVEEILKMYLELHEDYLAIPVVQGFKPQHRIFPGAKYTMALEALMPDLKSVQSATSHSLGQNFSSVFDIRFKDNDGKERLAWQACNGITTRVIGAVVMLHGDDRGLAIPPKIAPHQCIFTGIVDKKTLGLLIKNGIRFHLDKSKKSIDEKIDYWVLMGAPIIILKNKENYTLIRRDTLEKKSIDKKSIASEILKMLDSMQKNLFKKANGFNKKYTTKVDSWKEFENTAAKKGGFIVSAWCGNVDCARSIKDKTKNSLRVVNHLKKSKECVKCGKKAAYEAVFAPAY